MSNINDFVIENGVLKRYVGKSTDVVVPHGITKVKTSVVAQNSLLTSISIPSTVREIHHSAFKGCTSLKTIEFYGSLSGLEKWTFNSCTALEKIIINGSRAGDDLMRIVSAVKTLRVLIAPEISFDLVKKHKLALPAAMGYLLNKSLFNNQSVVEKYEQYISSQRKRILPEIFKMDAADCLNIYDQLGTITIKNFEEEFLIAAQGSGAINCTAFLLDWKNRNITPEEADKQLQREITKDPFNVADMRKLWSFEKQKDGTLTITSYKGDESVIYVPDKIGKSVVTKIMDSAFSPSSIHVIKTKEARSKLEQIREVIIPASITTIEPCSFRGCISLENIIVDPSNRKYKSIDGILFSKNGKTLIAYPVGSANKSYTIPNGVETIKSCAFEYCANLTEIKISETVTHIEQSAFCHCSGLKEVVIPGNVQNIESYAFGYCTGLTSLVLSDGVTTIGNDAFRGCKILESVVIPDSVESIGERVFVESECSRNRYWSNGALYIGNHLICGYSLIEGAYTIRSKTKIIANAAFSGCKNLTSIVIPNSVTTIGTRAFYGCKNLTSIVIPNSVTTIGYHAFQHCERLKSIVIPNSVNTIGSEAFLDCNLLSDVYYDGSEDEWKKLLKGNKELRKVTVHFDN